MACFKEICLALQNLKVEQQRALAETHKRIKNLSFFLVWINHRLLEPAIVLARLLIWFANARLIVFSVIKSIFFPSLKFSWQCVFYLSRCDRCTCYHQWWWRLGIGWCRIIIYNLPLSTIFLYYFFFPFLDWSNDQFSVNNGMVQYFFWNMWPN